MRRQCAKCNSVKSLKDYYNNDNYCKECRKLWRKAHYKANRQKTINKVIEYQRKNPDVQKACVDRWQSKNRVYLNAYARNYHKKYRLAKLMYDSIKNIAKQEGRW